MLNSNNLELPLTKQGGTNGTLGIECTKCRDFSCDEQSQAIVILGAIFRGKKASPLRFGWRQGRLRQNIVAVCDCDFWFHTIRADRVIRANRKFE